MSSKQNQAALEYSRVHAVDVSDRNSASELVKAFEAGANWATTFDKIMKATGKVTQLIREIADTGNYSSEVAREYLKAVSEYEAIAGSIFKSIGSIPASAGFSREETNRKWNL